MISKQILLQHNKLFTILETNDKFYLNLLLQKKICAIKHLPEKETIINILWKRCYLVFIILIKSKYIRSKTLSSIITQKNKWDIFLDQLAILNTVENNLHKYLFQLLLQELIIKQDTNTNNSFWNPKYNILSNQLLSPIKNSNLETTLINNQNNNNNNFKLQSSKIINKLNKEVTKLKPIIKTLKIPIQMNLQQQKIINEWINTSNYVYNKTLEKIKSGIKPNWLDLRDMLVTNNTKKKSIEYNSYNSELQNLRLEKKKLLSQLTILKKNNNIDQVNIIQENINTIINHINMINKDRRNSVKKIKSEKNNQINEWELNTPKEVRACAVKEVCKSYTTGFSELKKGNIKHFNITPKILN